MKNIEYRLNAIIYMKTTTITFKTKLETKKNAQKFADSFGVGLSAMMNILLNSALQLKTLSKKLDPYGDEEPSDWLIKELAEADEDIKAGRVSPAFDNAKDAIAYLRKNEKKYAD